MKHTILLVDDEQNILNSLNRLFEDEGYEILTARDGKEALKKLDSKKVSLVISDFTMPSMSGGKLLEKVKVKSPDTIRIMLTGAVDTERTIDSVNKDGIYRYVSKPWDDEELLVIVRDCLMEYESSGSIFAEPLAHRPPRRSRLRNNWFHSKLGK